MRSSNDVVSVSNNDGIDRKDLNQSINYDYESIEDLKNDFSPNPSLLVVASSSCLFIILIIILLWLMNLV